MPRERYRIADLVLDVGAATVERRGEAVPLGGLSFDLLVALARRAPDVLDHDTLGREVWKLDAVTDETIMQRVALLRRALGDDAQRPTYVRSVRGRGYALVPDVTAVDERPAPRATRWIVAGLLTAGVLTLVYARWAPIGERPVADVRTAPLSADELVGQADGFLARHRETDNELAIDLYERALELEAGHARALVGLSLALSQRVTKFNHPPDEGRRALELAERRLAAAPDDPKAHYARAFALDSRGRVGPALESYLRAAALDPADRVARADAAYLLLVRGELAESLRIHHEVVSAGVKLHYLDLGIGWGLALMGYEDAAAVWLRRAVDLWPDSVFAGSVFARFRLHQGRLAEAERLAAEAIERGVERSELHTILGHVALLRGDRSGAARRYAEAGGLSARIDSGAVRLLLLERDAPGAEARYRDLVGRLRDGLASGDEWPGTATDEMLLHAGFGDSEAALAALDTAIELGFRESAWLLLDPALVEVRGHPGFPQRLERIALEIEEERRELLAQPELVEAFLRVRPSG